MDCIPLFHSPDETVAIAHICSNCLIYQNVIKHTQAQICMFFCSLFCFFLKGAWFKVQHTSVLRLYLCQTLSIKQLSCSYSKYRYIFVKHASRKSFWHKFVPWLHNPEWNRFFSTIAAGVSLQYWWTHKSDKQIHDACSSIRFLSFESFGFFPLNEIICCSVAEIQRINLTYESTHLTQNGNKANYTKTTKTNLNTYI